MSMLETAKQPWWPKMVASERTRGPWFVDPTNPLSGPSYNSRDLEGKASDLIAGCWKDDHLPSTIISQPTCMTINNLVNLSEPQCSHL